MEQAVHAMGPHIDSRFVEHPRMVPGFVARDNPGLRSWCEQAGLN